MKKYLLFVGDHFYPKGGWDDLRDSSDDIETLRETGKNYVEKRELAWYQIVDFNENKIVEETSKVYKKVTENKAQWPFNCER